MLRHSTKDLCLNSLINIGITNQKYKMIKMNGLHTLIHIDNKINEVQKIKPYPIHFKRK